jgi:TonB family protein
MLCSMKVSSAVAALLLAVLVGGVSFAGAQDQSTETRKVVSRVTPSYPSIARTLNLTGVVKLDVTVAPSGSAKSVQVIGGNPVLAQSAESTVRIWKWEKSDHETTEHVEIKFAP